MTYRPRHCGNDQPHETHVWGAVSTITGPYECPGVSSTSASADRDLDRRMNACCCHPDQPRGHA